MQAAEQAKTLAMAQGQMADNLSWANRVQSLQDDVDLYTYINATNQKLGNEVQVLTNQIWNDRVQDLKDKSGMYVDLLTRDNAQNLRLCDELKARGGFTIGRVKFSDSDVDELLTAFNQAKQKNR